MGANTDIEWADSTWSPIRARRKTLDSFGRGGIKVGWHCEHVSEACRFCYAEGINRRLGTGLDFKPGHRADVEIFLDEKMLLAPLKWRKPRRIFVNSMSDTFAEFVKDEWIDRIFAVMALTRRHTFQVLTKRPARMLAAIKRMGKSIEILERQARSFGYSLKFNGYGLVPWPLPNVWLGTSAEDQATADERIPLLLDTPAAVRFVSLEPLLGPIDLIGSDAGCLFGTCTVRIPKNIAPIRKLDTDLSLGTAVASLGGSITKNDDNLHWVIVGGESGRKARPMHPQWARDIRDQCAAAGVPFFFKQWGGWAPHKVEAGGDLGGDVLAGRVHIVHPTGQSDVDVSIATGGRSTIPGSRYMARVGKKAAGRLLDGIKHDGMPT